MTRTGTIWLGLGLYLHRIDPMGSGKPLGCLPDPKSARGGKKHWLSGFRGSGLPIPPTGPYRLWPSDSGKHAFSVIEGCGKAEA